MVDKYSQYFKDHSRVKEFAGHSGKVHTVAWSADGKRLASGSLDKTACVFTLDKDRLVKGSRTGSDRYEQPVWTLSNPKRPKLILCFRYEKIPTTCTSQPNRFQKTRSRATGMRLTSWFGIRQTRSFSRPLQGTKLLESGTLAQQKLPPLYKLKVKIGEMLNKINFLRNLTIQVKI